MKYWARLENNIVKEIIQAEEKPELHPSMTIIECTSETLENDVYQNGFFSRPSKSIDILKSEKISSLNSLYAEKILVGMVFETNTYQIRDSDRQNMNDVYTKLADNQTNPHGGVWRDMSNTFRVMNDAKVKEFIDAVFAYRSSLLQAFWTHKDNINAMTRSEDVINYDFTTNW